MARASRKDARDAVVAARKAFSGWSAATAYNRGQVLYGLAETMETRHAALARVCSGRREVARAIDRVVWYAGWADKLAQVLGGANPVAGPYFNFTVPEPTGVVAVVAPDEPALDGVEEPLVQSGSISFGLAAWPVWVEPGSAPTASGQPLPPRIVLECGSGFQAYQRST